jgi:hypothetical protein
MRDALKNMKFLDLDVVEYVGTVKLHGTHGDVIQNRDTGEIIVQSRNRVLSEEQDNCHFAKFVRNRCQEELCDVFEHVASFHPEAKSIGVYGEFCGKKIQSGVGVSLFDPFFVIVDVRVDDGWRHSSAILAAIADHLDTKSTSGGNGSSRNVYSVFEFPRFHVKLDARDPEPARELIDRLTEEVGSDCPVARKLLTASDSAGNAKKLKLPGEGIVWKCQHGSRHWFKSKCEAHAVVADTPKKREKNGDGGNDVVVDEFLARYVTPARLRQGLDYLREFNLPMATSSTRAFVKWVRDDTLKEGADDDSLVHGDEALQKAVSRAISDAARKWWFQQPRHSFRSSCSESSKKSSSSGSWTQ